MCTAQQLRLHHLVVQILSAHVHMSSQKLGPVIVSRTERKRKLIGWARNSGRGHILQELSCTKRGCFRR